MVVKRGGKKKKRAKNFSLEKRELIFAEQDQEYGEIVKNLGAYHMDVFLHSSKKNLRCTVAGGMRKRVWCNIGDTVLVNLRTFQDNAGDIVYKYNEDEVKHLNSYGEIKKDIPENIHSDSDIENENIEEFNEDNIIFE